MKDSSFCQFLRGKSLAEAVSVAAKTREREHQGCHDEAKVSTKGPVCLKISIRKEKDCV